MRHRKITSLALLVMFLSGSAFMVGCDESPEADRDNTFEEEREELVDDLRDLRDDIDEQIDELRARMEEAGEDAEEEWARTYEELREARSDIDTAIGDAQRATEDTWNDTKAYIEDLHDRISARVDRWKRELEV